MSKIGPIENFDFWSKVNAKVKVNGQEKSTGYTVRVVSRLGHRSTAEMLMSSYDIALTRIRADEDVLAWLITSSNDIRMTSSGVLQRVGAHVTPDELQILQLCRLAGYKAIRAACVTIKGSEPEKSTTAHGEVG